MPDEDGATKADAETVPTTSQHAYKDGRTDDIKGDLDKVLSTDPHEQQKIEGEDELNLHHEKK